MPEELETNDIGKTLLKERKGGRYSSALTTEV